MNASAATPEGWRRGPQLPSVTVGLIRTVETALVRPLSPRRRFGKGRAEPATATKAETQKPQIRADGAEGPVQK